MEAKEPKEPNDNIDYDIELEISDTLEKDGHPNLENNPLFIPPLQQTLEMDKLRANPELGSKDPIIRKLIHKQREQQPVKQNHTITPK